MTEPREVWKRIVSAIGTWFAHCLVLFVIFLTFVIWNTSNSI